MPWPERPDRSSDFGQVVIELVIATGQQMHLRLRDHADIEVGV